MVSPHRKRNVALLALAWVALPMACSFVVNFDEARLSRDVPIARPPDTGEDVGEDALFPDAPPVDRPDVAAPDTLDASDGTSDVLDAQDGAEALDVRDAADVLDGTDRPDGSDVFDRMEVADTPDRTDTSDGSAVPDVPDALDGPDTRDVQDAPDGLGAMDALDIEIMMDGTPDQPDTFHDMGGDSEGDRVDGQDEDSDTLGD